MSSEIICQVNKSKEPAVRSSIFKRLSAGLLSLLLLFALLSLPGCGRGTVKDPDYLGEYRYDAPVAWLVTLETKEGDFLEYREVKDLYAFLTDTDKPVVLCVRQKNDSSASQYIPMMEDWAYKYRDKVEFVFADASCGDAFLDRLDYSYTPGFFLIKQGTLIMQAGWTEDNALKLLEETFIKEAKEES